MVFLELYTLPNATGGIDQITIQTVSAVPVFIPMLLVFVFFSVLLGGSARQKAKTGSADFPMWSVIASMAALMTALLLSNVNGLIRVDYLVITVVMTIFSGVWFFLDKRQSEV